ncbi:enoyl-CoA hydratase/isomerase family protein [Bradyrhizobium ottawaense]|uniref:enoyl-CoA hydratase/isomerase family protein n=1 Tax=Bradyrhizobium ottawaense TaxID=931866 RepID=UPI003F9EDC82
MAALNIQRDGSVLVAQFNRENPLNPLNRELEQGIVETCRWAQTEPAVRAIVLTGGVARSFGVGDDLNEARKIKTAADVQGLVDRTLGLYVAVLSVTKPTVAGIDGYAIGAGLQIALCCDWRVGTPTAKASGWELKQGLACPIGAYMLCKSFGRAAMSNVVFGCEVVPPGWGVEHKFFHEIAERQDIVERAIWRAGVLGSYPEVAYRRTKASVNRSFITGLSELAPMAKNILLDGFRSNSAQAHFARIVQR